LLLLKKFFELLFFLLVNLLHRFYLSLVDELLPASDLSVKTCGLLDGKRFRPMIALPWTRSSVYTQMVIGG
jgi:hypothetical protein